MEMFKLLLGTIMICRNLFIKGFCLICTILLVQCKVVEDLSKSTLKGSINCGGGARLELQDANDISKTDVSFSDSKGKFVFEEVDPGFYFLNASKDGWSWILTSFDNEYRDPIHQRSVDQRIKLESGKTTEVTVAMSTSFLNQETCEILDMEGNPIDEINFAPNTDQIAFQIFNGTGQSHYWSVEYDFCYSSSSSSSPGGCFIKWFTSMENASGVLEAGATVSVVGHIDLGIYSCSSFGGCDLKVYVGGIYSKVLYLYY